MLFLSRKPPDDSSRKPPDDSVGRLLPLNLPQTTEVTADARGLPRAVVTREGRRRVAAVLDVWRVDDEWWRVTISRRYFLVELEGGVVRTVYEDLASGGWYTQRY